jgi:hypothetical protein
MYTSLFARAYATDTQKPSQSEDLVGNYNRRQTLDILRQGITITTPTMPLTDLVDALRKLDREKPSHSQVDIEGLQKSHEEHSEEVNKRAIVHIPEPLDNPESPTIPTSKAALRFQQMKQDNAYNEQVVGQIIRERMEEKKKLEEMLKRPDLDPQMRKAIETTFALLQDFETILEKQLNHQRNVTGTKELSDEAIARATNFTIAQMNSANRQKRSGATHDKEASWTLIAGYVFIFAFASLVTIGLAVPGFRHYVYNPAREMFGYEKTN